MRRDFPALVHDHARRADHIVVSSDHTAAQVVERLDVAPERVTVCRPGRPPWAGAIARERAAHGETGSTILFLGTVEPRKNVGGLLDAYARLRAKRPDAPRLILAGRVVPASAREVVRASTRPLSGHVQLLGYVDLATRVGLYRRARMVVLPSFDEGFGLPVLEAMASGVPVVVSNRGSLPEVAGAAATPIDPDNTGLMAAEMERLLEPEAARAAAASGLERASHFSWEACAAAARQAYHAALSCRAARR
jgi:alpha-1,3-rhamnosyl/mannosyltransferase